MYLITKTAKKQLDSLPTSVQERVHRVLAQLETDPTLGWQLKGKLYGKRSIGVGRAYRMIFQRDSAHITILAIVHRKDAYR